MKGADTTTTHPNSISGRPMSDYEIGGVIGSVKAGRETWKKQERFVFCVRWGDCPMNRFAGESSEGGKSYRARYACLLCKFPTVWEIHLSSWIPFVQGWLPIL